MNPVALASIILALTLAPAWGGSIPDEHARGKPAAETAEQAAPLADLASDPKPLPGTGWSPRDLGDAPASSPPERVSALDIGGKLLAVLLCVYGLFAGVRLLKAGRLGWPRLPRSGAPAPQLRLIEALALGGNRRVYLVQAGGRTLLIGADASGLAALGEVPPSSPDGAASSGDTNEIASSMPRRDEMRANLVSPLQPLGAARGQRDEEDWARKRDLLIRALKENAVA